MTQYARRKDANHNEITAAFEKLGCVVLDTSRLGGGAGDIAVQHGGLTMLIEVKDGSKPPSARKLTKAEEITHGKMCIRIVKDLDDVQEAVRVLRKWHMAIRVAG